MATHERLRVPDSVHRCRHCDVIFRRANAAPIPNDRCQGCHEEIEAHGLAKEANGGGQ
ncbi:hypothetical protein [Halomonas sp. CKK8]|uniref:hypothetical protein n=1 Tax=Halomonas sp. CKK8 TaxID=3036127 RepID=UPI0024158DEC|nr:hypothetical protein [Halomonas sp. CKK8]WFM72936.1 hypothetical protein P8934_08060 [Halomonas sp. CKK8]